MACDDCQKLTYGLGHVAVIYTGGPESMIWEGLRATLPADSNITLGSDGTIRYVSGVPPSPPEGFQAIDDWTFKSIWPTCRSRVFMATVRECGLAISAVCMEPGEAFGSPVSCDWCASCQHQRPIKVKQPKRVFTLPPEVRRSSR